MARYPFTALEPTEDGEREVATSYDTITDLIEELQENAIDVPPMQYEDETEIYDAFAVLRGHPETHEELEELINSADEAYRGNHHSWADFAEEEATSLYDIPDHWPYNCIDWTKAADQLEWDYEEHNNYFFWRHA